MAKEFYNAISIKNFGEFTDDNKFNEIMEKVQPDASINGKNYGEYIMRLMYFWDKNQRSIDNESFMVAFMYDADSEQKTKYGHRIIDGLQGLADSLKKDNKLVESELSEITSKLNSAKKELNSFWWVDNMAVANAVDDVFKVLKEKMELDKNLKDY